MNVIWLERAEKSMRHTESYILREFGEMASEHFIKEVKEVAYLLEKMPELGHFEPLLAEYKQGYRSIVINRLNKLIYYIKDNTILIAAFWDCRREPKKLLKDIS